MKHVVNPLILTQTQKLVQVIGREVRRKARHQPLKSFILGHTIITLPLEFLNQVRV